MSILTIPYQASNVIPNYAAGVGKAVEVDNVAEFDGMALARWTNVSTGSNARFYINGVEMFHEGNGFSGNQGGIWFFIAKGMTYKATGNTASLIFYPLGA